MQQYSGRKYLRLAQTAVLLLTLGFVVPSFATVSIDGLFSYDTNIGQFSPAEVVYKIDITDFNQFSAQTVVPTFNTMGFGDVQDTELFLFDASGNAVYANDDYPDGTSQLSLLPNPSGGLGPGANGTYFLAVTFGFDSAFDSSGNSLFASGAFTDVVGPNPGAGSFDHWGGGTPPSDTDLRAYQINLTGVPEPSSLALLAPGLLVAWTNRKRFRSRS